MSLNMFSGNVILEQAAVGLTRLHGTREKARFVENVRTLGMFMKQTMCLHRRNAKALSSMHVRMSLACWALINGNNTLKANVPAQLLVFHIFKRRMMIARRCERSPSSRKMFIATGPVSSVQRHTTAGILCVYREAERATPGGGRGHDAPRSRRSRKPTAAATTTAAQQQRTQI
jgi:hypothetical protein